MMKEKAKFNKSIIFSIIALIIKVSYSETGPPPNYIINYHQFQSLKAHVSYKLQVILIRSKNLKLVNTAQLHQKHQQTNKYIKCQKKQSANPPFCDKSITLITTFFVSKIQNQMLSYEITNKGNKQTIKLHFHLRTNKHFNIISI